MMNLSVSKTEKDISPSIAKHQKTKGKNISVQKKSISLVSHLFSSLQSRPNAYIDDLRYSKIKRSHNYYLTEGNVGVGKDLTS